jgi:single-strand DNA-binding protein
MYNKLIVIGNLTRDIELKYIPSGAAIARGAIATSHKYKTQDGSQKEEVCFLDFNVFGKPAEIINQYVKKGSKVMLEGRLVFEQWTDKDGGNRSRHTLRVEEFKFLDSKGTSSGDDSYQPKQVEQYNNKPAYNSGQGGMKSQPYEERVPEINIDIDDDEIPF